MRKVYGRREFIGKHFLLGSTFLSAAIAFSECESKKGPVNEKKNNANTNPCEDLSDVSENDIEARIKFGYVKKSSFPDRTCGNCKLHIPPQAGKDCGKCLLFKGPVYSSGYCIYWAPSG
jgi:Tol biopolymer transport system component